MSNLHRDRLLDEFQQVIESAYQDMQGVLWGRKNYRLRHRELAGRLLNITEKEFGMKLTPIEGMTITPIEGMRVDPKWSELVKSTPPIQRVSYTRTEGESYPISLIDEKET